MFKRDLIKFCEIFTKITLECPQNSQMPLFKCKKLVIKITKCDVCQFLHKICCKMVWQFCEIWKSYWNCLLEGSNSVRFYLTVWDMACMEVRRRNFPHLAMKAVLVEKPIFRSLEVKIEWKCRSKSLVVQSEMKCGSGTSHLWKSWQNKCGKRNFRSLPVKAERQCGSRTSHIWQSRQSGSAGAKLHIIGSQCRTKVRTWNFRSLAVRTERKRNFRSLAVKAERKCRSWTSGLWQSRQSRSVEAEFQTISRQERAEARKQHCRSLTVQSSWMCGSRS